MDGFKNVNLNDVTASLVEKYFSSSDDDADSSIYGWPLKPRLFKFSFYCPSFH